MGKGLKVKALRVYSEIEDERAVKTHTQNPRIRKKQCKKQFLWLKIEREHNKSTNEFYIFKSFHFTS